MIRLSFLFTFCAFLIGTTLRAQEVGDFGSDDPVERKDMPTRGVIKVTGKDAASANKDHWMEYDWKLNARRSGKYQVRLSYALDHASLGVQFKLGEIRLRRVLTAALAGRVVYLGELQIEAPGDYEFALYAPTNANGSGFEIRELALVPTHESEVAPSQAADGSITLLARDATTWSETMRYEAKPEKNCLGFWTDPDDFAEWEFNVAKPGKYQVVVTQGCGGGNAGSEVAVKVAGIEKKFTVQDTGGFQNWKDVVVGEVELPQKGTQRLVVDPVNKVKAAVLDVQKVTLKPVP